jgi:ParB-like chromosome segregation protein Spo0J
MLKIEYLPVSELKTYKNNAKIHTKEQIEQIKQSIMEFGMNDPIAIWKNNEIIEGHGRLVSCMELGIKEVPVIRLDSLTDEQRKAYALVHNKLTMNTDFSLDLLNVELEDIEDIDMSLFGFDLDLGDEEIERKEITLSDGVFQLIIECESEQEMQEKYDLLLEMGIKCKTSTL